MIQKGLTREASGRVGAFDSVAVRQHVQEVDLKRAGGGFGHPVARHLDVLSGCKGGNMARY